MAYKTIKLSKLQINLENDRFEVIAANEKEAIDAMLSSIGNKIYKMAQHIMKNGLSPKPFYVLPDSDRYIVKDGNRRTTALKLMARPNLIDAKKHAQFKKGFIRLNAKYKLNPIKTIHCFVYDSNVEANKWVKLEHTGEQGGIGVVSWDTEEIQRFDIKHGKNPSVELQAIDFLRQSPYVKNETIELLEKVTLTNLNRLISNPKVREKLGLSLDNGSLKSVIDESEVAKGLSTLIGRITQPSFKVNDIYNARKGTDYVNSIPADEMPDLSQQSDEIWNLSSATISNYTEEDDVNKSTSKKHRGVISTARKILIPKTCVIPISNIKVNKIYAELQRLDVKAFLNCAAVTLRVFIELSVDTYLEKKNLLPSEKNSASKSGMSLYQKVSRVADHLSKLKIIDENISKGIKTFTNDKNNVLGIDTIQAYVHNNHFSPTSENLLATWDSIQEFMINLWTQIDITENKE